MPVHIVSKNFTTITNLSQLPFNKIGSKFVLHPFRPDCGWCGKFFEESVNKQCDNLKTKGIGCFGINGGTQVGQEIMQQLGIKPAYPQTFLCTVTGKDATGKPKVNCASGEGWFPADQYAKALTAQGFL